MTLQETTKGPENPTKQDTSKSLPKPIDPKEESKLRFDQNPQIDVDALGGPRNVISFLKATQTKIGTVALMEQIGNKEAAATARSRDSIDPILGLLKHEDASLRREAAKTIGMIGGRMKDDERLLGPENGANKMQKLDLKDARLHVMDVLSASASSEKDNVVISEIQTAAKSVMTSEEIKLRRSADKKLSDKTFGPESKADSAEKR